ncbi:MAG: glycosyltransferase family 2 protein [Proteobacteria bacterium]|nr:glycosyltransferase family 2 protein [Pseudomonadota bacterium]
MSPLVSVIIPTFNRKDLVLHALESVAQQTYPAIEAIVVDDASTDGTADALAGRDFPMPVHVVRLPVNQGPAGARNSGIRRATGKYIALLDSDDHWLPTKLARQVEAAERQGGAESILVYTQTEIRRRYETIVRPRREIAESEDIADYLFADGGYIAQPAVLLSARAAMEVPYRTDMRLHEDWDWYIRLQQHGVKFLMVPEALCIVDDRAAEGRSSEARPDRSLAIAEEWKPVISQRAFLAFQAKYVAPQLRGTAPLRAVKMIVAAYSAKAISLMFAILLIGRLAHPRSVEFAYRMRDLVRRRLGKSVPRRDRSDPGGIAGARWNHDG